MTPYRVGILAVIQESNTFLPEPTTLEHFRQEVLLTGSAIRDRFASAPHEIGGFFGELDRAGAVAVPIFAARAMPFGTVTSETIAELVRQLQVALSAAGPLDGLLVAPHGATVSASHPDVDGYWLSVVREQVGPHMPIIGTLDPHANLSPAMVAATNALFAYRTNPHLDQRARGEEAARLLLRTLRGQVRPVQAACFPPMQINIERQCTDEEPLKSLAGEFDVVRQQPGVLGASLLLGFPYADVAEMGSAALVVTDDDRSLAQQTANQLGQKMWTLRRELDGRFVSIADAVTQAATLPGPVCLLDMGDNVGGGSPADGTLIAWELHRRQIGRSLVILADPECVQQAARAGIGQRIAMAIGGKTDALHGDPLTADFTVRALVDGKFTETEARHGGFTTCDQGPTAIVEADSGLTVMVTTRRMPPFSLKQITGFGLDPREFRAIVAKGVNAPLAAYAPVCPSILRVNTPGVTTADLHQLRFDHRRRPMFPFEPDMTWAP